MARSKGTALHGAVTRALPRKVIEAAARTASVSRRRRKLNVVGFFWTLVLGFGSGRERTLAGLRRAYEVAAGHTLAPSAFYLRFSQPVVRWLRAILGELLAETCNQAGPLAGPLASFRDVVATDSTVIRLHDLLAGAFPACRTNHTKAALKLHAVYSVAAAGLRSLKLTAERAHDGPVFQVGKWVKDRLLLFDLGYFRYQLMSCITRNGGFFVVRLKKNADPVIVAVHRCWRGRSVPLVGRRLSEVLSRLQREELDVEVEIRFKNRVYGGVRRSATMRLRLVGVRDSQTGTHHLYLTNIPPERLSPSEIAQVYAARWLIELYFRQLKGQFRAEDMPSGKRHVVEALLLAALIAFAISRALMKAIQTRLRSLSHRVSDERWSRLFAEAARYLLPALARPLARAARVLLTHVERMLLKEAVDPNAGRRLLLCRVETRSQFELRYQRVAA